MEIPPTWRELREDYSYDAYAQHFGKAVDQLTADERRQREAVFRKRLEAMLVHNANADATYKQGVTRFTDWTDAERRAYNRARRVPKSGSQPVSYTDRPALSDEINELPAMVDYRRYDAGGLRVMTDIKDQGLCGNCYAFAATTAVEAHYALATGLDAYPLSVQQVTSCSSGTGIHSNGNQGCDGGSAEDALAWINTTYWGLASEWVYPFTDYWGFSASNNTNTSGTFASPCYNVTEKLPKFPQAATVPMVQRVFVAANVTQLPPNDADAFRRALAYDGPVAISVASTGWFDYESGIFRNGDGSNHTQAAYYLDNHAVLMVGYGAETVTYTIGTVATLGYWIVRNSWGSWWGEGGYIKLLRALDAADEPCAPPGWFTDKICGTSGCLLLFKSPS